MSNSESHFFVALYESICEDWGASRDADFGTQAHVDMTWSRLQGCDAFHVKGSHVKWGRWCNIFDAADRFVPDWHARLAPLYAKGFRDGWWQNWQESPIDGVAGGPATEMGPDGDDAADRDAKAIGADDPGKAIKQSNKDLKSLRNQCRNTLHLVTTIMSNRRTYRLFAVIRLARAPIRRVIGEDMAAIAQSSGSPAELYGRWVVDGGETGVWQVLASLSDQGQGSLETARFCLDGAPLGTPAEGLAIREDDEVAQRWLTLSIEVAGQRLLSMAMYGNAFPHMFVMLSHPDPKVVGSTLQRRSDL